MVGVGPLEMEEVGGVMVLHSCRQVAEEAAWREASWVAGEVVEQSVQ